MARSHAAKALMSALAVARMANAQAFGTIVTETVTNYLDLKDYRGQCYDVCVQVPTAAPLVVSGDEDCESCDEHNHEQHAAGKAIAGEDCDACEEVVVVEECDQNGFCQKTTTVTTTGTYTTPFTTTGTPDKPGDLVTVTVFVPPRRTTTVPGTASTPYTITGTPDKPGDPVTVSVFVPPGRTTTVPGTASTPYTITGTPPGPGLPPPVTVYTPPPPMESTSESPTESPSESTTPSETSSTPTPTPTPPEGACYFPPDSCDASGLTVQLYPNSISNTEGYGVADGESGVGPDYYLDLEPLDEGTTNSLSVPFSGTDGATGDPYTPPEQEGGTDFQYYPGITQTYAGMTYNSNNFTLVFTGYYVPETSGTYTICTLADNRDAIYVGSDSAFPCGDASNGATPTGADALVEHRLESDGGDSVCADIEMEAGFYYPIRSVYGNWGPPSSLSATIQGPDDDEPSDDITGRAHDSSCT